MSETAGAMSVTGVDEEGVMADRFRIGRVVGLVASLSCFLARPAIAIDLSGVYASTLDLFSTPCLLTFVQTGTTLTISGPCESPVATLTYQLSGTVDEATGAFSVSGVLSGACVVPGTAIMTGTGDGTVFSGTAKCLNTTSGIVGSKCNNGMLDANEECEDGNVVDGDCCSSVCRYEMSGSSCAADTNPCTADACDGAGTCQHLPNPDAAGDPCASDGHPCTADRCDGFGACEHPADPLAAGQPCAADSNLCTDDVCNATGQCTHPFNTDPCDDLNICTEPDVCSNGVCMSTVVPGCSATLDLSGDWDVRSENGFFSPAPARRYVQTGEVLTSTDLSTGQSGVGSVNAATGALVAQTPFTIIFQPCLEVIVATATIDAQEFRGTSTAYCGLEGTWGPFDVVGRRCDPVIGCACDVAPPCVTADRGTRIAVASDGTNVRGRWRWNRTPAAGATFGDPTVADNYRVCLKTAAGSFVEDVAFGNGWRRTATGYRYVNTDGAVQRIWLKATPNLMAITATIMPTAPPSLPLSPPATLRLIRLGARPQCFEATFDEPTVNTPRRFRARE